MGRRVFFSLALLVSTFAGLLSPLAASAAQRSSGGLSGNQYVDPTYAFSVTWDEDLYEAEELLDSNDDPYGISLNGDALFAYAFAGEYASLRACVRDEADAVGGLDSVTSFDEATDLDLPETDPDARAALYRLEYENSDTGDVSTFIQYIECRELIQDDEPVDGVFLVFEFSALEDDYEAAVLDAEDLLASVEFDATAGGSKNDGRDTTNTKLKPGVNGNVYLDPTNGWAITWDDSVLTAEEWDPNDSGDVQGVQLATEGGNFMTVYVAEAKSIRACVTDQVDQFDGSAFSDFEKVTDVDLPETGKGVRAGLYQGVFTSQSGDTSDIYLYSECRLLVVDGEEVDGQFLIVNLISDVATYEDDLEAWSGALTSVEFDAASAKSDTSSKDDSGTKPGKKKTPTADTTESGLSGSTYTSAIGYQVSWDDSVFTGALLDDSNPDLGLSLSSDASIIQFSAAGDPDADSCVEAEAGVVENLSGMSTLKRSREDSPQGARDSASQLYAGTLTFDSGNEADVVVYIECRPMGELDNATLFLVIRMVGVKDAYADQLPLWQDILDSIQFFDPSGQG
jgi:hypothetical protein